MKKLVYLIIILILILVIILNFYKSDKSIFNDIMIFDLWSGTGEENEYNINPIKEQSAQIDILKTINNINGVEKKIAPGDSGKFTIKLTKPNGTNCKILINEITSKPRNLMFILDGKKFSSLEKIQENINQKFQNQDKITINWIWQYDENQENNIQDTIDGQKAFKYIFEIKAIIQ